MMSKQTFLQLGLWASAAVLCFFIYRTVMSSEDFKAERNIRYATAIANLNLIRDAEKAYRDVNGHFTGNYSQLMNFVEQGKYPIIKRKDTVVMRRVAGYNYERETKISLSDTVGYVSLKDSLFRSLDPKQIQYYPYPIGSKKQIELKADTIGINGKAVAVFEASINKKDLLDGLDEAFVNAELEDTQSPIKEATIRIGSVVVPSTEGNWSKDLEVRARKLNDKRVQVQK